VRDSVDGNLRTVVVGKFDLQLWTALQLATREGNEKLPATYCAFSRGDFSDLARWALEYRREKGVNLLALLMDCASGSSPGRLEQIRREAGETLLGDAVNFPFPEICAGLPFRDLGSDFRGPVSSTAPVLFISGTFDMRTPVRNAEEVRRGFPRSHHLILEGGGHPDLIRGVPEMGALLRDFFGGRMPATERLRIPTEFVLPGACGLSEGARP
jgi:hypothetical protein